MVTLAIAPLPLLAAGLDWLEALLPVLFILFWILSQLFAVVKKVAGGGEAVKPAVPPAGRARPVAAGREVAKDLQDEIREFLRRELPDHRPAAPSGFPKPSPPSPPKPLKPRPATTREALAPPMPTLADRPRAMPQPTPSRVSGESIAEKVKEDFAKELEHLSTPLTADRVLMSPQPAAVAASGRPAAEIVRSLRSPATLRELVVIREILDRPVDRW